MLTFTLIQHCLTLSRLSPWICIWNWCLLSQSCFVANQMPSSKLWMQNRGTCQLPDAFPWKAAPGKYKRYFGFTSQSHRQFQQNHHHNTFVSSSSWPASSPFSSSWGNRRRQGGSHGVLSTEAHMGEGGHLGGSWYICEWCAIVFKDRFIMSHL